MLVKGRWVQGRGCVCTFMVRSREDIAFGGARGASPVLGSPSAGLRVDMVFVFLS